LRRHGDFLFFLTSHVANIIAKDFLLITFHLNRFAATVKEQKKKDAPARYFLSLFSSYVANQAAIHHGKGPSFINDFIWSKKNHRRFT